MNIKMNRACVSKLRVLPVGHEGNSKLNHTNPPKTPYELLLEKWKLFEEKMALSRAMKDGPLRWKGPPRSASSGKSIQGFDVPKMFKSTPVKTIASKSLDCVLFDKSVGNPSKQITHTSAPIPPLNTQTKFFQENLEQNQRKHISTTTKAFNYDRESAAIKAYNRQLEVKPAFIKPSRQFQTKANVIENVQNLSKSNRRQISSDHSILPSKNDNWETKLRNQALKSTVNELDDEPFNCVKLLTRKLSKKVCDSYNEVKINENKTITTSSANSDSVDKDHMNKASAQDLSGESDKPDTEYASPSPSVTNFTTHMDVIKSQYQELDSICRECKTLYPVPHSQKSLPTPSVEAVTELKRKLRTKGPICFESPLISIDKISGNTNNYFFSYNKDFR